MFDKFNTCLALEGLYRQVDNGGSYYVSRVGDTVRIFFEWSNGAIDWKHNFYFPAKPYRDMKDGWFCHRGFLKVWKSIEPEIMIDLWDPSIKKVEIVGYSHGGALAQLCYEYVKFNRPDVAVEGYGFGAPRVFWGLARKSVKKRFEGFVVVRNGNDIVTHLPPVLFGFRHLGKVVKVGGAKGLIEDHYPENYLKALEDFCQEKP